MKAGRWIFLCNTPKHTFSLNVHIFLVAFCFLYESTHQSHTVKANSWLLMFWGWLNWNMFNAALAEGVEGITKWSSWVMRRASHSIPVGFFCQELPWLLLEPLHHCLMNCLIWMYGTLTLAWGCWTWGYGLSGHVWTSTIGTEEQAEFAHTISPFWSVTL